MRATRPLTGFVAQTNRPVATGERNALSTSRSGGAPPVPPLPPPAAPYPPCPPPFEGGPSSRLLLSLPAAQAPATTSASTAQTALDPPIPIRTAAAPCKLHATPQDCCFSSATR